MVRRYLCELEEAWQPGASHRTVRLFGNLDSDDDVLLSGAVPRRYLASRLRLVGASGSEQNLSSVTSDTVWEWWTSGHINHNHLYTYTQ